MATPGKSIPISDQSTNKRILELKTELELRNLQIADLQQEIVDADQGMYVRRFGRESIHHYSTYVK